MQSLAHETCRTLGTLILMGRLDCSPRADSVVPIVLNLGFFCSKPHTQAYPPSVTTHRCWYPQLTCATRCANSTYRGSNTFRLAGRCPNTPFRFLPHVSTFPSFVTPADSDLRLSMSTKLAILMGCGRERLLSDPSPSSPLRPNPQDQTWPSGREGEVQVKGRRQAALSMSPVSIFLPYMSQINSELKIKNFLFLGSNQTRTLQLWKLRAADKYLQMPQKQIILSLGRVLVDG